MRKETATQKLESLAMEFVMGLRCGRVRTNHSDPVALYSPSWDKRISRETVRYSILLEFGDMGIDMNEASAKYGDKIDRWIEDNIQLIGEVAFGERDGV